MAVLAQTVMSCHSAGLLIVYMPSQVGNILLVMAHGDSVVKGAIGRRETLLALFGVMNKLERRERPLLKCLKCLRLLTCDPALLQPLQVSVHCPKYLSYSTSGTPC